VDVKLHDPDSPKKVVGLQYLPVNGLPQVIFKGCGPIAEKILRQRDTKRSHRVIRDQALLDRLYRLPVDSFVGADLFGLVAVVLAHVFAVDEHLKGKNLD